MQNQVYRQLYLNICLQQIKGYPPFSGITDSLVANGFQVSRSGSAVLLEIGKVLIKYNGNVLTVTVPGSYANQVCYLLFCKRFRYVLV